MNTEVNKECNLILYMMIFFSSLVVIQFSGRTLFLYLQIVFCIVLILSTKKIYILPFKLVNLIMIQLVFCAISGGIGNMPLSYRKAAVVMALYMVPLYFSTAYCYFMMKKSPNVLKLIIRAFKAMCIFQLVWIPIQYVLYHGAGIDINKVIFVDSLHLLDNASFIRSWVYYPSGFSWHSAVLAPMMVIAFFLFDNLFFRLLLVADAIICGNSTALVGVLLCIFISIVLRIVDVYKKRKLKIKSKTTISIILAVIIITILFYWLNLNQILSDRFFYLFERFFGDSTDASTNAHLQYFSDYLEILKNSSPLQILFGYGEGCSGYAITQIYGRYSELGNWAIECDLINILVSRGISGFLVYYTFLFQIAIRGLKIDRRYFLVIFIIFIQGFGYNIQWDYVVFMEIILLCSIHLKQNFFEAGKKSHQKVFRIGLARRKWNG